MGLLSVYRTSIQVASSAGQRASGDKQLESLLLRTGASIQDAGFGITGASLGTYLIPISNATLSAGTLSGTAAGAGTQDNNAIVRAMITTQPTPTCAFMAGSWIGSTYPGEAGYVGGNIAIGASSAIYGDIEAGNEFTSGGGTTIRGSVSALAQGTAVENSMGGSTTFNLSNLPPTLSLNGGATGGGGGGGTPATLAIQWARFL